MKDSHARSVFKGITWRVVASLTTMTIVLIMTGDLVLMAGVGMADILIKLFLYYFHERVWGKVHWGRLGVEPNLAQICDCHCHDKTGLNNEETEPRTS